MSKSFIILILITLLGAGLRFYRLGEVPAGFHRDEAFLGYNAYALLKTGTDMTGNPWPLHFESFLYSPAGYAYASLPFIHIFDLSPFSVRFASAFFGTLTIPLSYLFIFVLFRRLPHRFSLAVFTAFLLAITPWHINLSRTATENTLVVFFITLGTCAFLSIRKHYAITFFSFLCFTITLTIYQAPRAFLPLFLPLLFVYQYTNGKRQFRSFLVPIMLYIVFIILPVLLILRSPELATRMSTVSIFSTEQTQLVVDEQIRGAGILGVHPLLTRVMHNKIVGYVDTFLSNYFQHLSYPFLFTDKGLPDRYRVPYSGILYISYLPLFFAGLYWLFKQKKFYFIFLTGWVGIGFIGSALTFDDVPNLQRTLIVFPAILIIIAAGIQSIAEQKKLNFILLPILYLSLSLETSRYVYNYYIQQLVYRPWYRQEGYQQLVQYVEARKNGYTSLVITNKESAPAIFFLFFTRYDPKTYIAEIKDSPLRDFDRVHFSRYAFSEEECPFKEVVSLDPKSNKEVIECYGEKNTLYVNAGTCKLPTVCGNVLQEVKRTDSTRVFTLLEAK